MTWLCRYLSSSIGKKQLMAITGLLLSGFLIAHLLGNFLLMAGADAFNLYAYKLTSTPLIYIAEAGLVAIFLGHLGLAMKLTQENKAARGPQGYYMKTKTGKGSTLASSTMIYSGIIIGIFLVTHLMHFKFGSYYETKVNGVVMRDLYRTVIEFFQNPLFVAWYVAAMILLGLHLSHGVQSAFQSFGLRHHVYTPIIKKASLTFSLLVAAGFAALSIWAHFQGV